LLAYLPVRKAYRLLRIGDIWNKGAVEEIFLSSLLVSLAAAISPYTIIFFPVIWLLFARKHLLNLKGFLASVTALLLTALYYTVYHFCHLLPVL
jgi:integral membrane sensor domain MASE1